ncbi:MAG: hypothetical protein CM15mP73_5630 [Hyphomicrobiales bacterium]|nr:MAG: hypothetical protein CM15mP73_5630 [Hyphomicrobiales bacterium]
MNSTLRKYLLLLQSCHKINGVISGKDDLNIPNKQVIENTKPPIFSKDTRLC